MNMQFYVSMLFRYRTEHVSY